MRAPLPSRIEPARKNYGNDNVDPLMREAIRWVAHITSRRATEDDAAKLDAWVCQSDDHGDAYAKAVLLWRNLQPAAANVAYRARSSDKFEQQPRWLGRRLILSGGLTALGTGVAVALFRPPLGLWPSLPALTADYRTAIGERRSVALGGNTLLELNTGTSIAEAKSGDGKRGIRFIQGEAIVSAGAGEMLIFTGDAKISASAARFNIRNAAGQCMVTCMEGQISMQNARRSETLKGGQQIVYDRRGMSALRSVDLAIVTAWQKGLLIFDNETLTHVIDEVNRYRPGKIVLMDGKLAHRTVTATFKTDRLNEVVPQIIQVFGARATRLPGGVVLLS